MTRDEALKELTAVGMPYELVEIEAMGRSIRAFRNAPATLGELYASARSDVTFLVFEDERLTFADVHSRSLRLAAALSSDYGIEKGDRVAISMRNYPEWVIAFNAATILGAVALAMNALWQPDDMEYALNDAKPKVLFADQERLDRLALCTAVPEGLSVVAVRGTSGLQPHIRSFEDVLASGSQSFTPSLVVAPDDDAIMLYTSGSTGRPKGAVSTHRNVLSALLSWELDAEAAILTGLFPRPEGPSSPSSLLGIPLFHVSGLHVSLLQSYRAQRRLVCMFKWEPELAAEIIERERITHFNGPPAITGDLVRVARETQRDLTSLATVGGGGAARAPEQVRSIDEVFPRAAPATGWGMTETNAIGAGLAGADYVSHPASCGRVSAVLDIRIVSEDGELAPAGGRGELQIRGASIMRGYWNRPDANAESFVDGWFRTGDVAYVDSDGFVFIVDRIKDLVIRGGENIGCGAVEAALVEHPDVVEACVYGVPDERLGEEVGATLFVSRIPDENELRAFLAQRLARFEIPRYILFTQTSLPRIASGKIAKLQLRGEAAEALRAVPA